MSRLRLLPGIGGDSAGPAMDEGHLPAGGGGSEPEPAGTSADAARLARSQSESNNAQLQAYS